MRPIRLIYVVIFLIGTLAACGVVGVWFVPIGQPDRAAVTVGLLAVLISCFSTYSAQKVVDLQEQAGQPLVIPTLDLTSRAQLALLRVKNYGGSMARDICLNWDRPLTNAAGERIVLNTGGTDDHMAVLLPGASVAVLIDLARNLASAPDQFTFSGTCTFRDANGRMYRQPFAISMEGLEKGQIYDSDLALVLEKLPGVLDSVKKHEYLLRTMTEALQRVTAVSKTPVGDSQES